MAAYDVEPGLHLLSRRRKARRDPREFASRRRRARPLPALSPARCGRSRLLQRPHPARTQEPDRVRSRVLGRTHARHAACGQSGGRQSAPGGRPRPRARSTGGLGRALLGGGSARSRLPSRFAQAGGQSQPARARQASPRPQSSAKAENLPNRNPALPHRFRRALHQQPCGTGPKDDEGQNENLRLVSNHRRRSNLRPPQIRRLDREKTRPQHPPNPHHKPGSDHESPRRIADSLGATGANSRARTRTKFDAAGAKLSQKNHLQERQLLRTRGIAALAREFARVTTEIINALKMLTPDPKGRHYTGRDAAAWAAVILGGGWSGSWSLRRSSSSVSSGSGCV